MNEFSRGLFFPLLILPGVTPGQRGVIAEDSGSVVCGRGEGVFALAILPQTEPSLNTQVMPLSVYFATACSIVAIIIIIFVITYSLILT